MLRIVARSFVLSAALSFGSSVYAGPFAPQAGQPGSTAIAAGDPRFVEWASSVINLTRGPQNIANPSLGLASFGASTNALGPSDAATNFSGVVSLGDGGQITLGFSQPIRNGAGPDFAVFENGFASGNLAFLELGFVEVSSDGVNFFRFPATSLTQTTTQIGTFGLLDATNLDNLAGKYVAGFGTPFDLDQLASVSSLLDVNNVNYVRIVDAVGSIDPLFATHDSPGNMVNDPWPTPSASSGFDLDAVGVINSVPEPSSWALVIIGGVLILASGRRASFGVGQAFQPDKSHGCHAHGSAWA
ncbi:MAG TPA: PEP-CTERM sorting domain-containing protein [Pirellulales bacterium]|nr:PEP-CTERM sorting domain-containing protein [Pirellulales bacterium]